MEPDADDDPATQLPGSGIGSTATCTQHFPALSAGSLQDQAAKLAQAVDVFKLDRQALTQEQPRAVTAARIPPAPARVNLPAVARRRPAPAAVAEGWEAF